MDRRLAQWPRRPNRRNVERAKLIGTRAQTALRRSYRSIALRCHAKADERREEPFGNSVSYSRRLSRKSSTGLAPEVSAVMFSRPIRVCRAVMFWLRQCEVLFGLEARLSAV